MAATLLELRRRVLENLNDLTDEVAVSGDRYATTTVNSKINEAAEFYVKEIARFFQGYLRSTISIDLVALQDIYPLGPTFRGPVYQVRRVINEIDYPLFPKQSYHSVMMTQEVPNDQWLPTYELFGNSIKFSSVPSSAELGAVVVSHPMRYTKLVVDTDALDDQLYETEDCVALRATKRLLQTKDVSGALKNIVGWNDELKESELSLWRLISDRYVIPDKPQATVADFSY